MDATEMRASEENNEMVAVNDSGISWMYSIVIETSYRGQKTSIMVYLKHIRESSMYMPDLYEYDKDRREMILAEYQPY